MLYHVPTNYPADSGHRHVYWKDLSRDIAARNIGQRRRRQKGITYNKYCKLYIFYVSRDITRNFFPYHRSRMGKQINRNSYLRYMCNLFSLHQTWSQYGSNYSLHTPDDALYVYECVELELGLLFTDDDKKYNCPIHLHCDKGNKSRY